MNHNFNCLNHRVKLRCKQVFVHPTVAGFLMLVLTSTAIAQSEVFAPLTLAAGEHLTFEADERLILVGDATFEIQFAVPVRFDSGNRPIVVLSLGDGPDAELQVLANSDMSGVTVKIAGQDPIENIPCELIDKLFHQVAVVIRNGKAFVFVDGRERVRNIAASLGVAPTGGRSLHLGTDGIVPNFSGLIKSVRIWDRALTAEQLSSVADTPSIPGNESPAFDKWTAAAVFTSEMHRLAYREPPIETLPGFGRLAGRVGSIVIPSGYQLSAIYVRSEAQGIADVMIRVDSPDQPPLLLPPKTVEARSPDFRQRQRIMEELYDAFFRQNQAAIFDCWKRHLHFESGIIEPDLTSSGILNDGWSVFRVPANGNLDCIAGVCDTRLRTLRLRARANFDSQEELVSPIFGTLPESWHAGNTFSQRLPSGARCAGFEFSIRDRAISSITLKAQLPILSDIEKMALLLEQFRWVDRDERLPVPGLDPKPKNKTKPIRERKPYLLGGLEFIPSSERPATDFAYKFRSFAEGLTAVRNHFTYADNDTPKDLVFFPSEVYWSFVSFGWLNREDSPEVDKVRHHAIIHGLTLGAAELYDSLDPRTVSLELGELPTFTGPLTEQLAIELRNLKAAFKRQWDSPFLEPLEEGGNPDSARNKLVNAMGIYKDSDSSEGWGQVIYVPEPNTDLPWSPPPPVKSRSNSSTTDGNFTTPIAFKLRLRRGTKQLELTSDNGNRVFYDNTDGSNTYEALIDNVSTILSIDVDDFALWCNTDFRSMEGPKQGNLVRRPRMLIVPPDYDEVDVQDKLVWGATFSLSDRPTLCQANFKGYNLKLMHPRDHQADTGADRFIFRYPTEDSNDYYTTDSKVIVPFGLHFVVVNAGSEGAQTDVVRNSSERSESWSNHLGVHAGFGGASASVNASWNAENSQMERNGTTRAICRTVESRYALVLDKARMTLSDDFVARAYQLRDIYLATDEIPEEYLMDAIASFGTHYPYAVTYGGMAVMEMDFTENEISQMSGSGYSIDATAEATFAGFSGGASAGHSESSKLSTSRFESHERISFDTYGGSLSRGQGWSLPKGEEVPIYLDLREITDLLNPVFFEDDIITTQVRSRWHEAIAKYLQSKQEFEP